MKPSAWWQLVKQAGESWIDDYAPSMGAALACSTPPSRWRRCLSGLMGAEAAAAGEGIVATVR